MKIVFGFEVRYAGERACIQSAGRGKILESNFHLSAAFLNAIPTRHVSMSSKINRNIIIIQSFYEKL